MRPESFEHAVDILDQAERILTFGIEAAGHLTQTFALRLRRIGRESLSISASGAGLADTLLTLRSGDALVAIADEHSPIELTVVLSEARAHGVPIVLLTDTLSARSADHFSVALVSSRGEAGGFKTLTTTAVLLDTLLLGLAARDRARSLLTLERFDRLRAQLTRRRARQTESSGRGRKALARSRLAAAAPGQACHKKFGRLRLAAKPACRPNFQLPAVASEPLLDSANVSQTGGWRLNYSSLLLAQLVSSATFASISHSYPCI